MCPSILYSYVLSFIGSTHVVLLPILWMIMWYLFPLLELYGNFTVWPVYMVFLMLYAVINMSCLLSFWLLFLSVLASLGWFESSGGVKAVSLSSHVSFLCFSKIRGNFGDILDVDERPGEIVFAPDGFEPRGLCWKT